MPADPKRQGTGLTPENQLRYREGSSQLGGSSRRSPEFNAQARWAASTPTELNRRHATYNFYCPDSGSSCEVVE